ncbi:MAG: polymer-forming cytoskeletal protein [Gammaproteobacteria bacterium]|nr:polymer-forming cytoskeletal protein [Gammaproteobacteria bacterium]
MFGNGSKKRSSMKVETLVGRNTELQGDIHFTGGLHVDGVIKGNVTAESGTSSVLRLSEHGRIEGEVHVPHISLNGTVNGDVHATEGVELASHARVNGNVYYKLIEMAMGAEVNGNLVHESDARQPVSKVKVTEAPATSGQLAESS